VIAGHSISESALQQNVDYAMSFYAWAYGTDASRAKSCNQGSRDPNCLRVRGQVLGRLLEEDIVAQYASAHHITLSASDLNVVYEDVLQLVSQGTTVAQLLAERKINRGFISDLLARESLVRKVEQAVTAGRAESGPAVHVARYTFSIGNGTSRGRAYQLALALATDGRLVKGSAALHTQWIALSRLPSAVRDAVAGAHNGQSLGPFGDGQAYVVYRLLERGTHRYGRVARATREAQLFRAWLSRQLRREGPRCFDQGGAAVSCPRVG
jgi:hypothetical protein